MSHRYLGGVVSTSTINVSSSNASGLFTLGQNYVQRSSSQWPAGLNILVEYLLVAGGGGGGATGSGGGAGGIIAGTVSCVRNTPITITIGAGGAGGVPFSTWVGSKGNNSVFSTAIAYGGGEGYSHGGTYGGDGGSGGGAPQRTEGTTAVGKGVYPGSQYISGPRQGYDGGPGSISGGWEGYSGGGGGGGGPGLNGPGGPGTSYYSEWTTATASGVSNGYLAGGGAGGDISSSPSTGGIGGGGNAGDGGVPGTAGTSNTGGGGGGGGFYDYSSGGTGGSGLVIIKLPTDITPTFNPSNMQTSYTNSGYNYYKITSSGTVTL